MKQFEIAAQLRAQGKKMRQIGLEMGISTARAQQLVSQAAWRAQREKDGLPWHEGLSARTTNGLLGHGIHSKEALKEFVSSGGLTVHAIPNIGKGCITEVHSWLSKQEDATEGGRADKNSSGDKTRR